MKTAIKFLLFFFLINLAWPCQAEIMNSKSFSIMAAGLSCGGEPGSEISFKLTASIGQPSPIRIGVFPKSSSFRNFPGLRYQLEGLKLTEIDRCCLPSVYLLLLGDD